MLLIPLEHSPTTAVLPVSKLADLLDSVALNLFGANFLKGGLGVQFQGVEVLRVNIREASQPILLYFKLLVILCLLLRGGLVAQVDVVELLETGWA